MKVAKSGYALQGELNARRRRERSNMSNQPKTPNRVFRAPDEEWEAARERAQAEGRTLTDVLRQALREYAKGEPQK